MLVVGTYSFGAYLGQKSTAGQNLFRPSGSLALASSNSSIVPVAYTAPAMTHTTPQIRDDDDDMSDDDSSGDGPGATFEEVYLLLKHNYVDGVPSDSTLGHGAASSMVASLSDLHSSFLENSQMTELLNEEKGIYHGIGAVTELRDIDHGNPKDAKSFGYSEYQLTVVAALPGTPADTAGLKAGDVITGIDGHWVASYNPEAPYMKELTSPDIDPIVYNDLAAKIQKQADNSISLEDAEAKLQDITLTDDVKPATDLSEGAATPPAAPTTSIALTVQRGTGAPVTMTIPIDQTTSVPSLVAHNLPGGIGYIHITQFDDDTSKQLDAAITMLGPDVKGLIVDLRDSPGGSIDAAADAAGKLDNLKSLGVIETKGKHIHPIAVLSSREIACPTVVLINDGTANASELVAAALQSTGDKLIGTKTFGDGMDVAPVSLRDGSGFTMTVGQLFAVSQHATDADDRRAFDGIGIAPDVVVPQNTTGEDAQLNEAISELSSQVAGLPNIRG